MIGRTNGGVGTGALLIKVVGGLTRPENPTYGTVWLETEVPINGWEIYSVVPTWESVEGHVYLQDAPSTSGEIPNFTMIDPGKKPYAFIWERLIGAFQRINGTWVRLNGAMWRDGVWTPFFSATINVTYPVGSTCTATDGVTTLSAPDTSGTWDCVVPNAGNWTVALDIGFSEVVNGIMDGGSYTVDKWYLYNLGDERAAVTGGWAPITGMSDYWNGGSKVVKGANYFECTVTNTNAYSYLATSVPIDLTKINEICINVLSATAGGSSYHHRRISIAKGNNYTAMHINCMASTEFPAGTTGIVRLDVSKITGEYFIGVGAEYESSANGSLKVSGVWLR